MRSSVRAGRVVGQDRTESLSSSAECQYEVHRAYGGGLTDEVEVSYGLGHAVFVYACVGVSKVGGVIMGMGVVSHVYLGAPLHL